MRPLEGFLRIPRDLKWKIWGRLHNYSEHITGRGKTNRRCGASKIDMHCRVIRRYLVMVGILFATTLSALSFSAALPQTQDLRGEVVNEKNDPIVGAVCTLTSARAGVLPDQGLSQATDEKGGFTFPGLAPGTYGLLCAAVGYEPVEQRNLQITDQPVPFLEIALPVE